MTIASTTSKVSYNGSGSTGPFPITFRFTKDADIVATKRSSAGVETVLTLTTNYTITGSGDASGGALTLVSALAVGESLVISRVPGIVQEVDYVENSAFPAETHENALDLLTMICQSLQEQIDRSVKVQISSTITPDDLLDELAADVASASASASAASSSAGAADSSAGVASASAAAAAASAASVGAYATESTPGLIELSGTTRAVAGTSTTTAMSPADGVAQALAAPIWGVAGGTGDAITLTLGKAPLTALLDGMHVRFRATAANTGAATLNTTLGTTATGAKNIYKGAGTALEAGDIPGAGAELDLVYNTALNSGAGGWLLLNPYSTGLPVCTDAEAILGTRNDRFVSPLQLRNGLNAPGPAPIFAARGWLVFNGFTGVILASGNIASLSKIGTGQFTGNFTTAMPDGNYALSGVHGLTSAAGYVRLSDSTAPTTTSFTFYTVNNIGTALMDSTRVCAVIYR